MTTFDDAVEAGVLGFPCLEDEDGAPWPPVVQVAALDAFEVGLRAALPVLLAPLREFADNRGVNVGDQDDDWIRGFRQAQRECLWDARDVLNQITGGAS